MANKLDSTLGSGRSPDLPSRNMKYSEGYHFITIVTNNRIKAFKYKEIAMIAIKVISFYEKRFDYKLIGFIIMPYHIHFICEPIKNISSYENPLRKGLCNDIFDYEFSDIR